MTNSSPKWPNCNLPVHPLSPYIFDPHPPHDAPPPHLQCPPACHFYDPYHLLPAVPITNPSFVPTHIRFPPPPHLSSRDTICCRTIKKVRHTSKNAYCPHCATVAFQGNNPSCFFWYHLSMSPCSLQVHPWRRICAWRGNKQNLTSSSA